MPTSNPKVLYRGAASTTTTTTLYTVPASTTAVVTDIIIHNSGGSTYTYTLYLDGSYLSNAVSIAPGSTVTISLKQVLASADTIQGGASNAAIIFHISGVEIV